MKKLIVCLIAVIAFGSSSFAQTEAESKLNKKAQFAGGAMAWRKYLEKNLDANVPMRENVPTGEYKVDLEFAIDKEGKISNVQILSAPPLCKPCGTEAIRVLQASPNWAPAMEQGVAVKTTQTQSISFRVAPTVYKISLPAGPVLVKFENLALREAIKKAAATGKIVFAQFMSENCEQCDETAEIAMRSQSLASFIKEKCVAIKVSLDYNDRKEFIETYNPNQYIGTYFISGDEELLSRYAKTSSRPEDYIAEIEKASAKQMEGRVSMKELNEEWNSNPGNIVAMELNLQKRLELGWKTDSLLEIFVSRLPADSIKSKRELMFIASQAPSLFSQAYQIIHNDFIFFNSMWYEMPLSKRVNINQRIIYKSLHQAIDKRNEAMAGRVASYTASTYSSDTANNAHSAKQGYDKQWMEYYKGVNDTAVYLKLAVQFYDQYFMTVSVQDVASRDSITRKRLLDTAREEKREDPNVKGRFVTTRRISFTPYGAYIASELLRGALLLYTSTNNPQHLQKALAWAKRSKEFYKYADPQNIYGKLLYITGNKEGAVASQKEAIQTQKLFSRNTKALEEILSKMQANEKL